MPRAQREFDPARFRAARALRAPTYKNQNLTKDEIIDLINIYNKGNRRPLGFLKPGGITHQKMTRLIKGAYKLNYDQIWSYLGSLSRKAADRKQIPATDRRAFIQTYARALSNLLPYIPPAPNSKKQDPLWFADIKKIHTYTRGVPANQDPRRNGINATYKKYLKAAINEAQKDANEKMAIARAAKRRAQMAARKAAYQWLLRYPNSSTAIAHGFY